MNDFLEAANSSETDDDSEDRYEKLKKEEAGNDKSKAEKRYEKLQKEAKREFVEKQEEREQQREEEDEDEDTYITY